MAAYAERTDNEVDDYAVDLIRRELFDGKSATEDQFNELHNLVTKEFLTRIKSGEASTQDLKAAIDWLKQNDITGVAVEGNPLDKLTNSTALLLIQKWYNKFVWQSVTGRKKTAARKE